MDRRNFLGLAGTVLGCSALPSALLAAPSADRFRAPEWGLNRKFLRGAFGKVAYIDAGTGDPVLFLHGYPLSGFQWRGAVEQLELFYRCIVPDFLGLGATEAADGQDLSAPSQMAMLVALLDGLKIDRVHVVANDSGGAVAQLLAVHHPERVRTLLLTNCDTERQSPPQAMRPVIDLARQGLYVKQWIEPWYENREHARRPDQFALRHVGEAHQDTLLDIRPQILAGQRRGFQACRQSAARQLDIFAALRKLRQDVQPTNTALKHSASDVGGRKRAGHGGFKRTYSSTNGDTYSLYLSGAGRQNQTDGKAPGTPGLDQRLLTTIAGMPSQ